MMNAKTKAMAVIGDVRAALARVGGGRVMLSLHEFEVLATAITRAHASRVKVAESTSKLPAGLTEEMLLAQLDRPRDAVAIARRLHLSHGTVRKAMKMLPQVTTKPGTKRRKKHGRIPDVYVLVPP